MGEVYAIVSGKGGTGKTSICASVAAALASRKLNVLCIDCDVGLRNLDISLGMVDSAALSFTEVAQGGYGLHQASVHPVYPSLRFLTAPMTCSIEEVDTSAFRQLLVQARREFDFIFLDAPAGVDAGFRLVSSVADRFLLVTGPGPAALRDAARVSDLLALQGRDQLRLIVNRVSRSMLHTVRMTIDDVIDTVGVQLGGVVLEDSTVTLAAAFGINLMQYAPRCDAARAAGRIASRIQGYPVPLPLK